MDFSQTCFEYFDKKRSVEESTDLSDSEGNRTPDSSVRG